MGFGAEDEVRLSPFEDDKPKDAENTVCKAASGNFCQAKLSYFTVQDLTLNFVHETRCK